MTKKASLLRFVFVTIEPSTTFKVKIIECFSLIDLISNAFNIIFRIIPILRTFYI